MKKIAVPHLVMMIAGAVTLLFSFFAFWTFGDNSENAWGEGLFPIATFVPLIGLVVGGTLALQVFANVKLPAQVLGFSWPQLRLALSFFATLLMVGFLLQDKGSLDFGAGFWFLLLGAIALLVGAVLERSIGDTRTVVLGTGGNDGGDTPPSSGGTPPPPPPPAS